MPKYTLVGLVGGFGGPWHHQTATPHIICKVGGLLTVIPASKGRAGYGNGGQGSNRGIYAFTWKSLDFPPCRCAELRGRVYFSKTHGDSTPLERGAKVTPGKIHHVLTEINIRKTIDVDCQLFIPCHVI